MKAPPRQHPYRAWLVAAVLVAAAFSLRLIDLERQPLHFDEGNNVYFALHLPDVLRVSVATHDTDPPAHRAALAGWILVAGPSPFSIRLFSVLWSALTVALCYRLLRDLKLPEPASLLAAAILAFSPFALFYAQEAKGYSLTGALAIVSWWAWLRVIGARTSHTSRNRWARWLLVYIASTGLMLGAHYYTAPVLAMQWLWWLGAQAMPTLRQGRAGLLRSAVIGAVAQVLACLPVAVWIALTLPSVIRGSTALSSAFARPSLPGLAWQIMAEMSTGRAVGSVLAAGTVVACALIVIGGLQLWRRGYRAAFWFGVSFLVPVLGAFGLQQRITFFSPRFLLYALPCITALIAGCAFTLSAPGRAVHRASLAATAGLMALLCGAGIASYYGSPTETPNDFRPLIRDIRPLVQPGDAALSSYIWLEGMWASYAPDAAARLRWHDDAYSPDSVEGLMAPIARQHPRVWSFNFMRNPDADETLSVHWLKQHAAYADRFVSGNLAALVFDTRPMPPNARASVSAVFDQRIRLDFEPQEMTAQRSDTLAVTLRWSAMRAIADDVGIFVQLIGPDGGLIAQNDGGAVNGLSPSFTWQPGHEVVDHRAVLVRKDLPSGSYALIAGLYRRNDGARLLTETGQDHVRIATVSARASQVEP